MIDCNLAEVRHQVVVSPLQRIPQNQECVLVISIAGEEHLGKIGQVRQARNPVE